jgi:hypothetical protein
MAGADNELGRMGGNELRRSPGTEIGAFSPGTEIGAFSPGDEIARYSPGPILPAGTGS